MSSEKDHGSASTLEAGTDELEFVGNPVDPAQERALIKKLMWRILPILTFAYAMQLVDKNSLGYGAIFGLREDTGLKGTEYSWLGSAFYLGFLVAEFPGNWIAQRVNVVWLVGVSIILWGAVLCCFAAASNFTGLVIVRVLLGALESTISPCFIIIVGLFFLRSEQPAVNSIWQCGLAIGNSLGGLIAFGTGHIHVDGVAAWKWVYIIYGLLTCVVGAGLLLIVPPSIERAKFLTPEERRIATRRLASNATGGAASEVKWYQVREAFCSPLTWAIFFSNLCCQIPNGGYTVFNTLIVKGLGFTSLQTTLLNIPVGIFQGAFLLLAGYISRRWPGNLTRMMTLWILPALVGSIALYAADRTHKGSKVGLLFALWILAGWTVTYSLSMSLASVNTAGRTKRSVTMATLFVAYAAGNVIGPQLWLAREAPVYTGGIISMIVCLSASAGITFTLRFWMVAQNKRRDTAAEALYASGVPRPTEDEILAEGQKDLTDFENVHFRYQL